MSNVKLSPCPQAGEGVNDWVNSAVLRMLRAGYTNATIYSRLIAFAEGCGRDIRKDITHSIDTGRLYLGIGQGFGKTKIDVQVDEIRSLKDLPQLDPEYQSKILEQNKDIYSLNWPTTRADYDSIGVLHDLYGKNRICIGYRKNHSLITHLVSTNSRITFDNKRIRLGLCQFIVPTPMVGEYHINKTGKRAVRCLNNTGERWNLVIEFDHLPSQDDQIRLHYELAKLRTLRMLVFSGNESVHGWYDVYRKPEKENKKFMKEATRLGADPMTWIRCQYVRFPGGVNSKTRKEQKILYYNYGQ